MGTDSNPGRDQNWKRLHPFKELQYWREWFRVLQYRTISCSLYAQLVEFHLSVKLWKFAALWRNYPRYLCSWRQIFMNVSPFLSQSHGSFLENAFVLFKHNAICVAGSPMSSFLLDRLKNGACVMFFNNPRFYEEKIMLVHWYFFANKD